MFLLQRAKPRRRAKASGNIIKKNQATGIGFYKCKYRKDGRVSKVYSYKMKYNKDGLISAMEMMYKGSVVVGDYYKYNSKGQISAWTGYKEWDGMSKKFYYDKYGYLKKEKSCFSSDEQYISLKWKNKYKNGRLVQATAYGSDDGKKFDKYDTFTLKYKKMKVKKSLVPLIKSQQRLVCNNRFYINLTNLAEFFNAQNRITAK